MAVVMMANLLSNFRLRLLISEKYLCLIKSCGENAGAMVESNIGFVNKET